MWEAIKSVPAAIGGWRQNRNLLYQIVASLAAALVIASIGGGPRPSDSLATVFHGLGWAEVGSWFGAGAPPFLMESHPALQSLMLSGTLGLSILMVLVPLWRGRHEDSQSFMDEPFRLIGSPAAASVWVLLLIAAQQSDITPVLLGWRSTALPVALWTAGLLATVGMMWLFLFRLGLRELGTMVARWVFVLAYRLLSGLVVAGLAVGFAAVWLPLVIISGMAGLSPDRGDRSPQQLEVERAEQTPLPAGATSITQRRAA